MFKNKVAVISGSRRGIGKAIAYELANKGCNIVINDWQEEEKIQQIAQDIKEKYHVDTLAVFADVSVEEEVKHMIETILKYFGKIDILVNNAAIVYDQELAERTVETFNKTITNNVTSTYLMSKLIGQHMAQKKEGKIINISSTNEINAYFPTSIDYDAGKAAVISLTNNFALEFAPFVNVNAVAPGWVNTPMNEDLPKELVEEETKRIFLKRFAEPEEIAKLVSFLASDDARYINGETIKIDGGYQ